MEAASVFIGKRKKRCLGGYFCFSPRKAQERELSFADIPKQKGNAICETT